jgi:lysophospholipase L1-like esterase
MFVGDSNIERALTALGIVLTDRDEAYELVDVARAGTGIRSFDCGGSDSTCRTGNYWKTRLPDALEHTSPDGYVVDLGINDTVAPGTSTTPGYAAYDRKIDWLMRLLPNSKPVWWTNLPCAIEPAARATGCAAVNSALAAAPQRWPNLTVLDWASHADTHPTYLLSTLQHIHFSEKGALVWSRLIARALDERFPE